MLGARPRLCARALFDGSLHQVAPRWFSNPTVAAACYQYDTARHRAADAVAGYVRMLARGARPDAYTFPSLLKAVSRAAAAAGAAAVHAHAVKFGLARGNHVASALVFAYAGGGDGPAAHTALGESPSSPVAWNALISGHNRARRFGRSRRSFADMVRAGVAPTRVTYVSVLSACGKGKDALLGAQVHRCVLNSGALPDLSVGNALVDMYAKCADMDAAWKLFDSMLSRDVVSWTSLVSGFARSGQVVRARELFNYMPERDAVSWTVMIGGYVQATRFTEALEMFREMQYCCVKADEFTMVSMITACAQLGALEMGEWVRIYMSRHEIKIDVFVGNALIDMYSKYGSVERALEVFKQMSWRDKFTWTGIILGLAVNGYGEEAIDMFHRMINVSEAPDEVTFIGVLTACTHSGLVDKGRELFHIMVENCRITPNLMHYGCMIDFLGRAGKLKEAMETICKMPMRPNPTI